MVANDDVVTRQQIQMADNQEREALEARLRSIDEIFERELRERGFEPDQVENVALPGPLATLYAEREALRAQLKELKTA